MQLIILPTSIKNIVARAGNITTSSGAITSKTSSFDKLAITRTPGRRLTPTSRGVFIGCESSATTAIEISADTWQYIDFTTTHTDFSREDLFTAQKQMIYECVSIVAQQRH